MKLLMILSLVFVGTSSFAKGKNCTDYSQFSDVTMTEMQTLVKDQKATIVDVNSDKSFASTHIPGALHFGANKDNFAQVLPKDKGSMIVAYCGGKMCTAWQKAAKAACEMGYTNIRHFSEGIKGWDKSNPKNS